MIERKEQIADRFMNYFHHYGFKKTSVDEVAADLHISKKTIYAYFDSKEAVFTYVIQREAERVVKTMDERLSHISTAQDKLTALISFVCLNTRTYLENTRKLEFNDPVNFGKFNHEDIALLAFQVAYEETLKQILEEGVASMEFHAPIDHLTLTFVKAIIRQSLEAIREDPTANPEEQTSRVILKIVA